MNFEEAIKPLLNHIGGSHHLFAPLRKTLPSSWRTFQDCCAKFIEGTVVPLSGGGVHLGDVITEEFLGECKSTKHKSISLQKSWVDKVNREASVTEKIPIIFIEIQGRPFIMLEL